jgi:hypothetical protein
MANGVAALRTVHPEPAPDPEFGQRVGVAVADAAGMLSRGLFEYWGGKLSPETKMAGGEKIAALYELTQTIPAGIDFAAMARTEGKRTLWARHGADFPEPILDEVISEVLSITFKVADFLRRELTAAAPRLQ